MAADKKGYESPVVHEYDGIEECDNHLPNWWLWTFYGTIIFGIGYWFDYHTFHTAPHPLAAYEAEDAAIKAAEAEKAKKAGAVTPAMLITLSRDEATLKQGKEVFTTFCFACHLATGGGSIGPNLTDAYWLHGGSPDKIYLTIKDGWPLKGMQAWGPTLGEERVRAATAYVLSIKNSNVPGGKPPQGEKDGS